MPIIGHIKRDEVKRLKAKRKSVWADGKEDQNVQIAGGRWIYRTGQQQCKAGGQAGSHTARYEEEG